MPTLGARRLRLIALMTLAVLLLGACDGGTEPPGRTEAPSGSTPAAGPDGTPAGRPPYDPARDYFSYADPGGPLLRHLELDLRVDFDRKELRGHAVLHLEAGESTPSGPTGLWLDNRGLRIDRVRLLASGEGDPDIELQMETPRPPDPVRGRALFIPLPERPEPGDRVSVRIDYRTGREASALMWLPPELTAGGEAPFLFTQSQSIHARSWVPLQDTPAVRFTYEAVIHTPPGLRALMSADNDPRTALDGKYRFSMPQPIPSYLLALAVGRLDFAAFGDRTGIYAEPEVLPAAVAEFADTDAMLRAAEAMWGPYAWGRYDLLILPPSFPYGGMENPRLSFLTPSLIAGDGSLVSTVAHELAHSWSGNLVSNATWRDIWLNEGMTTYLEGRLMEVIYDRERADEERLLNYQALLDKLETVPRAMQPLAPRFDEGDPDIGQDGLEYSKGQLLLDTLEQHFTRPVFDAFLERYFHAFAWQAITTEQFLEFADQHLLQAHPGVYPRERLATWLYEPGIPGDAILPRSASLERAALAATEWASGLRSAESLANADWSPLATVHFIQALPETPDPDAVAALDAALGFSDTQNAEIARAWFTRAAQWRYLPAYGAMREYLGRYGRIRLLKPVYGALVGNGEDLALARTTFAAARANYHPLTIAAIEPLLSGEEGRQTSRSSF